MWDYRDCWNNNIKNVNHKKKKRHLDRTWNQWCADIYLSRCVSQRQSHDRFLTFVNRIWTVGDKNLDTDVNRFFQPPLLWTVVENPTRLLHKDINSPVALNNFIWSTGSYRQQREICYSLQSAHLWPIQKWIIRVNCYKSNKEPF